VFVRAAVRGEGFRIRVIRGEVFVRAAVRGERFRIRVIRGEVFRVGAQSKHWRGAWRNY
jgi:hypothetical protein